MPPGRPKSSLLALALALEFASTAAPSWQRHNDMPGSLLGFLARLPTHESPDEPSEDHTPVRYPMSWQAGVTYTFAAKIWTLESIGPQDT